MPICQWSKSILTAPHPTHSWTFFQLRTKFFFVEYNDLFRSEIYRFKKEHSILQIHILSSLSCRMNQYNLAIINLRAHSVLKSWSWKQMWKDTLEPIQEKNLMHANFAHIEAVRKELYSTTSNTFMEIFPIEKKLIFVVC